MTARPAPIPLHGQANLDPSGRKFPWGRIEQTHYILNVEIVEYVKDNSNLGNPNAKTDGEHGQLFYHPFIDGRDTSRGYNTIWSALVGAIDYMRRGPNSQAAEHFDLMTLGTIEWG